MWCYVTFSIFYCILYEKKMTYFAKKNTKNELCMFLVLCVYSIRSFWSIFEVCRCYIRWPISVLVKYVFSLLCNTYSKYIQSEDSVLKYSIFLTFWHQADLNTPNIKKVISLQRFFGYSFEKRPLAPFICSHVLLWFECCTQRCKYVHTKFQVSICHSCWDIDNLQFYVFASWAGFKPNFKILNASTNLQCSREVSLKFDVNWSRTVGGVAAEKNVTLRQNNNKKEKDPELEQRICVF